MADTGWKFFTTTGFDVSGFGSGDLNNWTNPTNAYEDDTSYATAGNPSLSRYQSYGSPTLGVPSGATIDGIEVEAVAKRGGSNISLNIGIHQGSGTWRSKSVTLTSATDQTCSYGASNDLWGGTWSDTNFSNANFALYVGIDAYADTVSVDYIKIKVYYTIVDITISAEKSTINIEAKVPTVIPSNTISAPVVTINIEAKVPDIRISALVQPPVSTINIEAKIPSLIVSNTISAQVSTINIQFLIPIIRTIKITSMTKNSASMVNATKHNSNSSNLIKHNSTVINRKKLR